MGEDEIITCIY